MPRFKTDYSNDTQAEYSQNLVAASDLRNQFETTWTICTNFYAGEFYNVLSSRTAELIVEAEVMPDLAAVNMTKSSVDTVFSSVAVSDPEYSVFGQTKPDEDAAELVQQILRYWWDRYAFQPQFRRAVKDRLIMGHGWVKALWHTETDFSEPNLDEISQVIEAQLVGGAGDGVLVSEAVVEAAPEKIERLVDEHPKAERISPYDIWVDPYATTMEDASWICQRMFVPVAEVRANKEYSRTYRNQVEPSVPNTTGTNVRLGANPERDSRIDRGRQQAGNAARAEIFEMHDLVSGQFAVWAEGVNGFLIKPQDSPYFLTPHKSPYEMIRGEEVPGRFYPMGIVESLVGLQQELNSVRSQLNAHRRRYARKFVLRDDVATTDVVNKLASDVVNEVIVVKANNVRSLEEVIMPVDGGQIPAELYNHTDVVLRDFERVSTVTDFRRGMAGSTRRTATEVAALTESAGFRSQDLVDSIEAAAVALGHRMVTMAQQFLTKPVVARVVGEEAAKGWVQVDPAEIEGAFDFKIIQGSSSPKDSASRRADLQLLLQSLAPLMASGMIDPIPIVRKLLESFDIKAVDEIVRPGPGPDGMAAQEPGVSDPNAMGDGTFPTDPSLSIPPG